MSKVAKLVYVSLLTRVIVEEGATEQEIMELAIPKLSQNLMDSPYENIEKIVDDVDSPFNEEYDEESMTWKEIKLLEKARQLLYASDDIELLMMVKAIINHEDENEIIDYIDEVVTWEKVEFSFTAEQFCQEVGYTGKEFSEK